MSSGYEYRATRVVVTDAELIIELEDGGRYAVPLSAYPILEDATPRERARWQLIGGGVGIHWPEIDEDIFVACVVHPDRARPMRPDAIERIIQRNRQRRRNGSSPPD